MPHEPALYCLGLTGQAHVGHAAGTHRRATAGCPRYSVAAQRYRTER